VVGILAVCHAACLVSFDGLTGGDTGGQGGVAGDGGSNGASSNTPSAGGSGGADGGGAVGGSSAGGSGGEGGALSPVALEVQYRLQDSDQPDNNRINPVLEVFNRSNQTIDLSDVTVRYWYTMEFGEPQYLECFHAVQPLQCNDIVTAGSFESVAAPLVNADTYLVLSFTEGTPQQLIPNGSSGEFKVSIRSETYQNYNELNDHSYGNITTQLQQWPAVTAYYQGQLAWGDEPLARP